MAEPTVTAPSLRDRIAEALVDAAHDQYPEGMRPGDVHDWECPWGMGEIDWYGFADAVLAVLADADPTDLGFKWVDGITYCTFHDATVTAERARAGACDRAHHFCAEVPVYARPRTEEP